MFKPQKKSEAAPKQAAAKLKPKTAPAPTHSPAWANQPLQRSLKVNQPGDRYEQEADQVAEQVMRMPEPRVQRRCACGGAAGPDGECAACRAQRLMLQRQEMLEEEEEEVGALQRKTAHAGETAGDAPSSIHQTLSRSGQPLDNRTRAYMEPRFGQDFSDVRVHTDAQAAQSAADVSARAYTVGNNIVFGAGQYQPGSSAGDRLIAHELAHTVQQNGRTPSEEAKLNEVGRKKNSTAVRQKSQTQLARFIEQLDPTQLSNEQLEAEALRVRTWLNEHIMMETDYAEMEAYGRALEAELLRRGVANDASQSADFSQFTDEELGEAGIIAAANLLRGLGNQSQFLRNLYNEGARAIERAGEQMAAQGIPEEQIARNLSNMRHELALKVRRTGSTLFRLGAELYDNIRGQRARPTYESLRTSGKTPAQIIQSASRTNTFINRLPRLLRYTGRTLWFVQAGISLYVVLDAPTDRQGEVAQDEIEGILGGIGGALLGEAICLVAGAASGGILILACGLVGGLLGFEGARRGNLLQILDIAPHAVPGVAGNIYRIDGTWEETDLFIFSIPHRVVSPQENVLVVATGQVSGSQVGGRGHYRSYEVTPANANAESLFGNHNARYVPDYLLHLATPEDLQQSQD